MRRLLLVAALLGAGCASTAQVVAETPASPDLTVSLPATVAQGALVTGNVPAGTRLMLDEHEVRVSATGRVVFGVARERTAPLHLVLTFPDRTTRTLDIAVSDREFPLERITGVPEDTVNPPPAIAERIADEQRQVAKARERDDAREDWDVKFQWPLTGRISGVFGSQRIYNGTPKSPHSGLDVAAPQGTPVHAPAAGIVTFADPDLYLTGGTVLIDHGHGVSSSFLHLSRIDVKVGDRVEQGQPFALVGKTGRATGPHMHWGLNWFDTRVDPQLLVDPAENNPSAGPSLAWRREDIVGLRLRLADPKDPDAISELAFGDGYMAITAGRRGGPVTSPASQWWLEKGLLYMGFKQNPNVQGWSLVSRDANTLVMRSQSGELRRYEILKRPR